MTAISEGLTLPSIVMPGSHDAGLSDENTTTSRSGLRGSVITQNLSVGEQCLAGSRFFDLRFDDSSMRTFHAPSKNLITLMGGLGQGVKEIAADIADFLKKNPTEFVLLRLSKSGAKSVKALQTALDAYLYKGTGNLCKVPIKELRGKALLVWDKGTEKMQVDGVHPYAKYGNTASTHKGIMMCGKYSNSKNLEMVIQKQRTYLWEHLNHPAPESHIFVLYWTQTFNIGDAFKKGDFNSDVANFSHDSSRGVGNNTDTLLEIAKEGDKLKLDPKKALAVKALRRLVEKDKLPDMLLPSMAPIKRPNVIFYDFVNISTSEKIVALNNVNDQRRKAIRMTKDDVVELSRILGLSSEIVSETVTGPTSF